MKKLLKRILTVTLSIMMILAAIPVQAAPPSYLTKSKTITLYTGKTAICCGSISRIWKYLCSSEENGKNRDHSNRWKNY